MIVSLQSPFVPRIPHGRATAGKRPARRGLLRILVSLVWCATLVCTATSAEITDLAGKKQTVSALRFEKGWTIHATTSEGTDATFQASDVISLTFPSQPQPPLPGESQLLIGDEETLVCSLVASDIDFLTVQSPVFGATKIPLSAVRGAILNTGIGESRLATLRQQLRQSKGTGDVVRLENGDVIQGTLLEVSPREVVFERQGNEIKLAKDVIQAIVFDPSLYQYEVGAGLYAQVRLSDGSLVNIRNAESLNDSLKLETVAGSELTVPLEEIIEISFRNGRVVYLSDLPPAAIEVQPFLDDSMAPRMNLSVLGTPLRLGEQTYSKGIGVRSQTKLQYELSGSFERLQSVIGLDAQAGPLASVRFVVLLDGRQVFDSGEVTPGTEPQELEVPVGGAKRLELLVDFANRGDVQDYANWCDCRLIR